MGGEGVLAEDLVGSGDDPERQRWFLKIADAVDFSGDQVAGFCHVLSDLGMGGVDIVKQRGREERGKRHSGKNGRQEHPHSQRGRGLLRAMV
jgi:hypothetical protein